MSGRERVIFYTQGDRVGCLVLVAIICKLPGRDNCWLINYPLTHNMAHTWKVDCKVKHYPRLYLTEFPKQFYFSHDLFVLYCIFVLNRIEVSQRSCHKVSVTILVCSLLAHL